MSATGSNLNTKRTKIVATLGPTSRDKEIIRAMIRAGVNVARINFSHGDHETHGQAIQTVREIAQEEGAVVAVMCDIQGPKIRIGKIANEPLMLAPGDKITLTLDEATGENNIVTLPHPEFIRDIKAGMNLLLDDGKWEFIVQSTTGRSLVCEVVVGGPLTSRKGVSAPSARLTLSAITDKDRKDIEFAVSQNTEYIAMSFVRSQDDIREMRWLLKHLGSSASIIAKIEKHEALEAIESIVEATDGVMVARGDLGVEIPTELVPFWQKRIIRLCNEAGKPVITATQMLNSMVESPRPTRAEATDVYNAILDGTDAVMLSNESASGAYPVLSVETMADIASIAERNIAEITIPQSHFLQLEGREAVSDAVSHATVQIAKTVKAKAIFTTSMTGYTARRVARERPQTPIICVTPNELTYTRMALIWGVQSIKVEQFYSIDEMIRTVIRKAHDQKIVDVGDQVVIIAGAPFGIGGQTNFLKIHTVGESGELDD